MYIKHKFFIEEVLNLVYTDIYYSIYKTKAPKN